MCVCLPPCGMVSATGLFLFTNTVCIPAAGLMKAYSSLILIAQPSYDQSLLFKVYGLLLKKASAQCNLDWNAIYGFFMTMADRLKLVQHEVTRYIAITWPFFIVRME